MADELSPRELERRAVADPADEGETPSAPGNTVRRMLLRRGISSETRPPDLPFPSDLDPEIEEELARQMGRYAFRLFLRGAIQRPEGFAPEETTRYLEPDQAREMAESLIRMDLATRLPDGRYRLLHRALSFGGTLEWYVARELRRRFAFEVATGLTFPVSGVGGDLDLIATAEGKLVYLEIKSSPPRNIDQSEADAFLRRVRALRPEVALFVVDTALRLADKVVPMLLEATGRPPSQDPPRCVIRELWALTPHIYAVNSQRDLMANLGLAIAEGLKSLAPSPP